MCVLITGKAFTWLWKAKPQLENVLLLYRDMILFQRLFSFLKSQKVRSKVSLRNEENLVNTTNVMKRWK